MFAKAVNALCSMRFGRPQGPIASLQSNSADVSPLDKTPNLEECRKLSTSFNPKYVTADRWKAELQIVSRSIVHRVQ